MKKAFAICSTLLIVLLLTGCAKEASVKRTVQGNLHTYYEMTDGTRRCEGRAYQYRLEISGRMPNAVGDSTFVYLSNLAEIPFERAYMAAGLSSNTEDYFSPEEAVPVEMKQEKRRPNGTHLPFARSRGRAERGNSADGSDPARP